MLEKSLALAADSLVLDLEDAVTPERKDEVRGVVAGWLADVPFGAKERVVRINPLASPWGRDDLERTMQSPPDAYLVPKVSDAGEVAEVDRLLDALEELYGHPPGGVELILLGTETPRGVLNLPTLCASPRVGALTWGAEDLSAALGAAANRDERGELLEVFRYCRTMTLLAARAAAVEPIDSVYVDLDDTDGLRREAVAAARMGFAGKITIHPSQVPVVNEAFTPSAEEIEASRELVAAFEESRRAGRMAFSFRGRMVDVPHLERARRVLERARAAGVDTLRD
jgi:citrate lyase subunit beta/citryl-CoA lyase